MELDIHFDGDDGAPVVLHAEYVGHVVAVSADNALLDIDQVRRLRDWLNEVVDNYAPDWYERLRR